MNALTPRHRCLPSLFALALGAALAIGFVIVFGGCHKVVRDEGNYKNEVARNNAVASQLASAAERRLLQVCACVPDASGALKFADAACEADAHLILLARTRAGYFGNWQLYNAGLIKERPPKDVPEVPASGTLCPRVVNP